jgi:uncharacterized protein (DUF433 family)
VPADVIYPHISKDAHNPAHLERHPRTRVSMIVADYLWHGWSAEEIVRQYPYLSLAEAHAALVYYFDHRDEIEAELAHEYREAQGWKNAHPSPQILVRLKREQEADS